MSRRARTRRDKRQPWQDQDDNIEARESGFFHVSRRYE